MPTAPVNGIELYYETCGQGLPIVFAHGVGGNHVSWFQQIPYFSRWYQVITFDHRCFGNSRDSVSGPGRSAFVDDLKGLLDHLRIDKTILVAQSMGGGTCSIFSLRYPERVLALVLADTLIGINLPEHIQGRVDKLRSRSDKLSMLDRVLSKGFRVRQPALAALYAGINSFNLADRFTLRGSLPPGPTPQQLASFTMPILFVVGLEDGLFPPEVVRMVQHMIPGSSIVEIANAGHSVYFEQPDIFNHVVHQFLRDARLQEPAKDD